MMIIPDKRSVAEIDQALLSCKLLALQGLVSLLSAILLFVLAITRTVTATLTLVLSCISFVLWCFTLWQKGIESLVSLVSLLQHEVSHGRK